MHLSVDTAEAMEELGSQLGQACLQGTRLYLQGDLGAGKTTLVRGFLRALGYEGKVKSPTYTLVEPYEIEDLSIFHFDLYRLDSAEELEGIGFRDYFDGEGISLVEWPEKAESALEEPDLKILISITDNSRQVELQAVSPKGKDLLLKIQ
ncbi:MAG: tRNA (adenosine(37)-N6)-threonylcarbamoyltransferase complex ATPase subunit type 1 TsaE [Gammaproteobacteria bacterium]|jgi:tRNA threonylcarbamoyladenosine biosynthesis protein TsaE|nr:tRNA (adenosine(37)-N6)-threonylcarbamoyltransferase complex ATPase subunit type 1 TsaE [Gammaproteobacteria bacterium]